MVRPDVQSAHRQRDGRVPRLRASSQSHDRGWPRSGRPHAEAESREVTAVYKSRTGIPQEEYDERLAAQGGGCAICGNAPKTRRLHVDHDHKTGKVRGLLCHRCNRRLDTTVTPEWLTA